MASGVLDPVAVISDTFGIKAFNAISEPADVINQDHSPWYVRYWSHRIRALKN